MIDALFLASCLVLDVPYGTSMLMKCPEEPQNILMHVEVVEKSTPYPHAFTSTAEAKVVLWERCSQKTVSMIISRSNEHGHRTASVTCGGPEWNQTYVVHGQIVEGDHSDPRRVKVSFPE